MKMIHSFLFLAIFLTACQPENTSAPQPKNVPVIPYEKMAASRLG